MKLYNTSVSPDTDRILCEFLCSEDGKKDIRGYKKKHGIVLDEPASTEAVLYQMHKKLEEWERNVETSLLEFDEELYPYFVDQNGAYSNSYESSVEEQRITFFVRTMESARTMKATSSWCMNQHWPQAGTKQTHGHDEARTCEQEASRETRSMNTGSLYSGGEAFASQWDTSNQGSDHPFHDSFGHGRVDVPPAMHPKMSGFHRTPAPEQQRQEITPSFAASPLSNDEANLRTISRLERELNELRAAKQTKTNLPHFIE